ncbi:family 1 glycosylhydrolase [Novosphingobium cyanobacteriorum]|uniref:Family 1 glycosylhydrolase n=1 Tax=Novosphingobium cyanobacteriorum TaxID=3024215 RepID=A0ABT6CIW7_9SPHN|nr:family 1 glycosylhydrolase [Novosphingobium cyanobacteriorum]MDF8333868.1 family 1 glycosylhydrolase [Novosphingobium cyanobacteriorum]
MFDRRTVLAGAAALSASPLSAKALRKPGPLFPKGFIWGAATAPHQVEGNNTASDLWLVENVPGSIYAEPSLDAANSLELWPVDLDLVKALGLNAYRFGIEWARIEPEEGRFSIAMLDHYKRMIEGCRERGIMPIVTFNHFTTPLWFAKRGGWGDAGSADLFARYCERAARHLAAGIGYATTLNEPNLAGKIQELLPGNLREGDKATQEAAARAVGSTRFQAGNALYVADVAATQANMIAAHMKGRAAIKGVRPDLPVGTSLAMLDEQAAGKDTTLRDKARAHFYDEWLNAVRGDDFLGVQNYERHIWGKDGQLPAPAGARLNTMGAEVWPGSLAGTVRYAHAVSGCPIMVTEHGVGTDDDTIREWLIPAALADLKLAMEDGVPVLGYVHWSLVDNFEWGFGYRIHFGLHSLDRTTFERKPKPSAAVLGAIARANSLKA